MLFFVFSYPEHLVEDLSRRSPEGAKADFCLTNPTSTLFAILIDNEIHSRPAVGLSKADLVYEAPAEAGITRFLAVFCYRASGIKNSTSEVEKDTSEVEFSIGPVRSLRPYFLDFAEELGAPIVHVGGSPESLQQIKNSDIPDLDQYYNGRYFWRSSDRAAPHNVFTNLKKLSEFLKNKFSHFESEREVWKYKTDYADAPDASGAADDADNLSAQSAGQSPSAISISEISIDFLRPEHLVKWVYDKNTNSYFRYQNGARHADEDGKEISVKNIIIQITDIEIIDEIGRRRIRTTGEGKAMFFLDGKYARGTWKKLTGGSLTRFYDLSGQEIQLNPGKIWIEIVSEEHKVSIGN